MSVLSGAPGGLPAPFPPMLASPWPEPFDDPRWSFEPKWDGGRVLAFVAGGEVRLSGRRSQDQTRWFPEIVADLAGSLANSLTSSLAAASAVLDGEVVCPDAAGVPSFHLMQRRFSVADPPAELLDEFPVSYLVFDLLWLDGDNLCRRPLEERRGLLAEHLRPGGRVAATPVTPESGRALFASAAEQGLEGIVAKRNGSLYHPGAWSADWRKIKVHSDLDVVICGWLAGQGRRGEGIGSLVLGAFDGAGNLVHVGQVGTGFTADDLRILEVGLQPLKTDNSPFAGMTRPPGATAGQAVTWVRPEVVAIVRHRGWGGGRDGEGKLRAPSFVGIRPDKAPEDCVLEGPAG